MSSDVWAHRTVCRGTRVLTSVGPSVACRGTDYVARYPSFNCNSLIRLTIYTNRKNHNETRTATVGDH